jgi:aryl-alcohol dehydrogenase-like predicted oxidoreductase
VKAGKTRYIGASSMFAWQFAKSLYAADAHGWTRFASMQNHLNLLYREEEREMLPLCRDEGIGIIPVEPDGARPPHPRLGRDHQALGDRQIRPYALRRDAGCRPQGGGTRRRESRRARGVSRAQVALAWVLAKPGVTAPIIGASKPNHLTDAVAAAELKLSAEEIAASGGAIRAGIEVAWSSPSSPARATIPAGRRQAAQVRWR